MEIRTKNQQKTLKKNKNLDQKPRKHREKKTKTKKTIFQNSPDLQPNPRVLRYCFFCFCFFGFLDVFLVFGPNFGFFRRFFGFWSKFLFFHVFLVFGPNFCFFQFFGFCSKFLFFSRSLWFLFLNYFEIV